MSEQIHHSPTPGSLRFGEYFGIELRLHWTFVALAAWIGLSVLSQTGSLLVTTSWLLVLACVPVCVALHEYGHALMARRYGIGTVEITLLPIGGVAQLERIPEDPEQELWIALAGPATNFALVAGLTGLHVISGGTLSSLVEAEPFTNSILTTLVRINLILGVFNLIPALPMDGGRVLRALLSMRMPALRATAVSTTVSRVLAAAMMLYGLVRGEFMLALIGGFVWMTARGEYQSAVERELQRSSRNHSEFSSLRGDQKMHGSTDPPGEWVQPDQSKPTGPEFIRGRRNGAIN